jgi:hypothetical protein
VKETTLTFNSGIIALSKRVWFNRVNSLGFVWKITFHCDHCGKGFTMDLWQDDPTRSPYLVNTREKVVSNCDHVQRAEKLSTDEIMSILNRVTTGEVL